ncbi:MAG: MBL fold metallo-hydrolase [Candidatus Binataceae bacterium]|jgi:glyoxylase-like metal-dependent hydrolase (beta-lactamase superfamily II)/rhodanese-related sulfurtransferase
MFFRELNRGKCKTYMLGCERTRHAVLIDPLRENTARYIAMSAYHGFKLEYVIDTHTHADHRSGTWDLADLTDAKVVMERHAPAPHVNLHVTGGDVIETGDLRLQVLYTPGHTPDGLCLYDGVRLFTGDTLLIGGTGRADFAGGDAGKQYDAITGPLFALPDTTMVFPAHDYRGNQHSTIGKEKASNPRVAGRSREEYINIMNNLGLPLPDKIQEALLPNQSAIEDDSVKFPDYAQLSSIHQVTVPELQARLASGNPPVIVDVREQEEYRDELGHIADSRLIPLKLLSSKAGELESLKNAEIVAVCRAGVRSATAAAMLTALGFEHVSNLKGGMLEWNEAGLPVER